MFFQCSCDSPTAASSTSFNETSNLTQISNSDLPSTMATIWVAFFSRSGTPLGCRGPSFRDVDSLPLLSFRTSKLSLGVMVGLKEFRVLSTRLIPPPASGKPGCLKAVSWQML